MICTLKLMDFHSSMCCSISGHRHGRAAYKGMVWNYKESQFYVKWCHDLRTHDGEYVSETQWSDGRLLRWHRSGSLSEVILRLFKADRRSLETLATSYSCLCPPPGLPFLFLLSII